MSASSVSLRRLCPFKNPSNAAIPFKTLSGVAELSLRGVGGGKGRGRRCTGAGGKRVDDFAEPADFTKASSPSQDSWTRQRPLRGNH